ncbi:MAG: hypothetical protein PVJ39_21270 [Gammaproteobacteria bacterium]
MKQRTDTSCLITVVRELATNYDAGTLTRCMEHALNKRSNPCYAALDSNQVVNVLAKANFVKQMEAEGLSVPEAMRELGKRMRALESKS